MKKTFGNQHNCDIDIDSLRLVRLDIDIDCDVDDDCDIDWECGIDWYWFDIDMDFDSDSWFTLLLHWGWPAEYEKVKMWANNWTPLSMYCNTIINLLHRHCRGFTDWKIWCGCHLVNQSWCLESTPSGLLIHMLPFQTTTSCHFPSFRATINFFGFLRSSVRAKRKNTLWHCT